jgi:hypothetical protein
MINDKEWSEKVVALVNNKEKVFPSRPSGYDEDEEQTLQVTVTFLTKQNPGTEDQLREVFRAFLQSKGALSSEHIRIEI